MKSGFFWSELETNSVLTFWCFWLGFPVYYSLNLEGERERGRERVRERTDLKVTLFNVFELTTQIVNDVKKIQWMKKMFIPGAVSRLCLRDTRESWSGLTSPKCLQCPSPDVVDLHVIKRKYLLCVVTNKAETHGYPSSVRHADPYPTSHSNNYCQPTLTRPSWQYRSILGCGSDCHTAEKNILFE